MKKTTVLGLLTLLLSGIFFIACSKQSDESNIIDSNNSKLRSEFLKGKNQDQIIAAFSALTPAEKTNLWVEKTNQLLSSNLPVTHKNLIAKLKNLMLQNNDPTKLEDFRNTLVSLAKITPAEDFFLMVEKMDDYKFQGRFIGKTSVSDEILNDLKNLGNETSISNNTQNTASKTAACNCRYTCWMYGGGSSNCKETVDGCGPFGMSTCNGHV